MFSFFQDPRLQRSSRHSERQNFFPSFSDSSFSDPFSFHNSAAANNSDDDDDRHFDASDPYKHHPFMQSINRQRAPQYQSVAQEYEDEGDEQEEEEEEENEEPQYTREQLNQYRQQQQQQYPGYRTQARSHPSQHRNQQQQRPEHRTQPQRQPQAQNHKQQQKKSHIPQKTKTKSHENPHQLHQDHLTQAVKSVEKDPKHHKKGRSAQEPRSHQKTVPHPQAHTNGEVVGQTELSKDKEPQIEIESAMAHENDEEVSEDQEQEEAEESGEEQMIQDRELQEKSRAELEQIESNLDSLKSELNQILSGEIKNKKQILYTEESLTKAMLRIDAVESGGDTSIRSKRKELIGRVEELLVLVDEFKRLTKVNAYNS